MQSGKFTLACETKEFIAKIKLYEHEGCFCRFVYCLYNIFFVFVFLTENELPAGFPIIVTHPQDVQEPRPAVHFNCVVIGQQPLTITWYHERVPISSNSVYRISMIPSKKKVTSNLEIENVSLAEKGFYQCVATNQFGQVVSKQANVLFSQHGAKRRYRRQVVMFLPIPSIMLISQVFAQSIKRYCLNSLHKINHKMPEG